LISCQAKKIFEISIYPKSTISLKTKRPNHLPFARKKPSSLYHVLCTLWSFCFSFRFQNYTLFELVFKIAQESKVAHKYLADEKGSFPTTFLLKKKE
jgi:hypothetical protein